MGIADFLVIGGGIAGLSAAAQLAPHGRTIVLEAEQAIGVHASGRSATMVHYGIGDRNVRGLTSWSRSFFEAPSDGFAAHPLVAPTPALFVATAEGTETLDRLRAEMELFSDAVETVDQGQMLALCPVLRPDMLVAAALDRGALRLDSDALLQGFARAIRARGGAVLTGRRAAAIARRGPHWQVTAESGESWTAPVLVNAAGAWADAVARLAGVQPLGLRPLRRTIVAFDPPAAVDVGGWPFVKDVGDAFYMLPDAGRLLASPVDEVADEPGDARPEEYDIALAAWRVEEYTSLKVAKIAHSWAGLRTFTADRVPVAGFAADAPGFFWLAGQGGYGLQTAPAMAAIAEALITGSAWPKGLSALGVTPGRVLPLSRLP